MNVYWLEQTESDVPAGNGWLRAAEIAHLDAMRFAKRRSDWRLGRWTAKRALAAYLKLGCDLLRAIELRVAPSGAPQAYFAEQPAPVSLSLSHRNGSALCAVAPPGVELGCDLEAIEPHSDAFLADYFTPEEQALVARASAAERVRLLALLWSSKESALKALCVGLRLDTRSVIASPLGGSCADLDRWQPLYVRCAGSRGFHGWWQQADNLVRTLVAAPSPAAPIALYTAEAGAPS